MTSARHTPKQIKKTNEGIIKALEGERWLNAKQIRCRMAESRIYVTGQFVSQRCRILEGDGKIERLITIQENQAAANVGDWYDGRDLHLQSAAMPSSMHQVRMVYRKDRSVRDTL